ncbi:MAG: TlpA family protein disulfide reductase [Deltaproteobacteria bacterium]|nr:TlpA family protein disulfide reductase [Deltaproteobacteria bacterium]
MIPASYKNPLGKAAFFFLALCVFALAGCGEKTTAAPVKAERSKQLAPPFTVKTLGNKVFSLASKRGSPVVVNFWASWCTPCAIEAPVLERIYRQHKGRGVEFIAIAVDDTQKDVQKFVNRHNLTFPVGLDENGNIVAAYGANIIPQTYVIGADGYISYTRMGIVNEEKLVKEIAKLLPSYTPIDNAARDGKPAKKTARAS